MNLPRVVRVVVGGALLLGLCPGCIFNVEPETKTPPKKGGVDIKVDRDKDRLDVDVDIKKPNKP